MSKDLPIPEQQYFLGDVLRFTDLSPLCSWKKGDHGLVTYARAHKVCSKGGIVGLSPENGGPEHTMEWAYVVNIGSKRVRVSRLTPIEVVAQ